MSKTYNGSARSYIEAGETSNRYEVQDNNDSELSEEEFRGFERIPTVLCERIDITPYLNDINTKLPLAGDRKTISNVEFNKKDMDKLLQPSCVVLVRDDLEKLKDYVKNTVNDELKCNICDKTYSSLKKLQNHKDNKHIIYKSPNKIPKRVSFSDHIIVHEVKEYHRCRKCPKIFEDYNSLRMHMKQHHKKRKCYICFYCSKEFVDRMFFKVHIKLHCDSCGVLLANKKKYAEHRRYICRIIKKYECKTCNMSFFNYMDLKDHSYDHLGTFFICDICKDQFETKCSVAHHIKFLHTKKQPENMYRIETSANSTIHVCNFCGETSVKEDEMRNHVSSLPNLQNRAMTGYKDYYFCDQCLKKFTTETDMLQHKWTHYLKSSDNSQLRNGNDEKNALKTIYRVGEELPDHFKPKVVLEKLPPLQPQEAEEDVQAGVPEPQEIPSDKLNIKCHFNSKGTLKKVIDPITKKTIISNYQCEHCSKYLSSRNSLNRHLLAVHGIGKERLNYEDLQCRVCEEVFVLPWMLQRHRCIRMHIPEMPFDDARPEIHFDNLNDIDMSNDYMDAVDYEIPSPIVEITEFDDLNIVVNGGGELNVISDKATLNGLGYKLVMQEVPIEF